MVRGEKISLGAVRSSRTRELGNVGGSDTSEGTKGNLNAVGRGSYTGTVVSLDTVNGLQSSSRARIASPAGKALSTVLKVGLAGERSSGAGVLVGLRGSLRAEMTLAAGRGLGGGHTNDGAGPSGLARETLVGTRLGLVSASGAGDGSGKSYDGAVIT